MTDCVLPSGLSTAAARYLMRLPTHACYGTAVTTPLRTPKWWLFVDSWLVVGALAHPQLVLPGAAENAGRSRSRVGADLRPASLARQRHDASAPHDAITILHIGDAVISKRASASHGWMVTAGTQPRITIRTTRCARPTPWHTRLTGTVRCCVLKHTHAHTAAVT